MLKSGGLYLIFQSKRWPFISDEYIFPSLILRHLFILSVNRRIVFFTQAYRHFWSLKKINKSVARVNYASFRT